MDDIVLADIKGRRFHAVVRTKGEGQLGVMPIESGVTFRTVTSRQVVNHWRKTKNSRKSTAARPVQQGTG